MLAWIKEHKALAVGGIFALILLIYIMRHSSSAPATASGSASDVAAASAAYGAQQQAASQSAQIGAALQANAADNSARVQLATIQANAAGAHDQLAAQVATSDINAQQQVQSLLASLSADVAKTNSNNDVARTQISVGGATAQQQILANALIQQSNNQAAVAIAGSNNQARVAEAGYGAAVQIQQGNAAAATQISMSHDQHSGGLFGGGGFLGLGF